MISFVSGLRGSLEGVGYAWAGGFFREWGMLGGGVFSGVGYAWARELLSGVGDAWARELLLGVGDAWRGSVFEYAIGPGEVNRALL